ncbi:HNH endonuclease [Psychrobacillus sp. NPDC093180]|uniref:HNH endonuclease n=1 Tax=Psychrobacillus sp. NPDC093180 TaxID=3364489 RepID=UPI0037FBCCE0
MGVFRDTSKLANTYLGGAAKGGVKLISNVVSKKNEKIGRYVGELGETVIEASKCAVDSVGQFADGTVQGVYGIVKKDTYHKQQGWGDIKDSTGRTIKGVGSGIKYTVRSTGITLHGIMNKDKQEILQGVGNLGKVVAVSAFAIGVFDIVDGPDLVQAETLETRNDHLAGLNHSETGVPFIERTIELPTGELQTGTFPSFASQFSIILAEEMYLESDNTHFQIANQTLYQAIQESPKVATELGLSQLDVQALANGITPAGYDWHHNEQPGVLQLVDEETHQNTGHTGGREIWGGGSEHR